jgi:hypothetical protein
MERFEFARQWAGWIAITGLKRQNFPVFSRETRNSETETSSPMTAPSAS